MKRCQSLWLLARQLWLSTCIVLITHVQHNSTISAVCVRACRSSGLLLVPTEPGPRWPWDSFPLVTQGKAYLKANFILPLKCSIILFEWLSISVRSLFYFTWLICLLTKYVYKANAEFQNIFSRFGDYCFEL